MRHALLTALAVVVALPLGWLAGVVSSILLTAGRIGQLPILMVPAGMFAALVFVFLPRAEIARKLKIMLVALGVLALAAWVLLKVFRIE